MSPGLISLPGAPRGFDILSFPAALIVQLPFSEHISHQHSPSHVDIPSQEENVNYMAQHASTEGKFSVCFFMGVLLSAEVPNASILTILNKRTVYVDLLISWLFTPGYNLSVF